MERRFKKPKNEAEGVCFDKLRDKGWEVTKKGYPDFFCSKDGEICFVEVKPRNSATMTSGQIFFMDAMHKLGIPCYKFTLNKGFQKWEDIGKEERETREELQRSLSKQKWEIYND